MKHLLVIFGGQSGKTRQLCEAVCAGAVAEAQDEVELRCLPAASAGLDDLLWAQGLLIGTPENFGYMAGIVKDFFDRTFYPAQDRVKGLPYAIFISAGNDGSGAARAIERIAIGYGFKPVAEPLIVKGEVTEAALTRCRELGAAMAAGLAAGVF
ncbi:NADPH-dependent FMN reductase [Solimonas aquatica]|uniref:NADPH-dependent FMN reductase n=1 Tax=Solimonas aquatica TaxID=489703 RepID=A0A1H9L9I1_9GAMM|nr:NAD(P)H-dependent oxidoreductase [Solimonas aquatica]SER08054.1 NADPH-dependent FMN reductase [Solimonas aquatica]